MEERNLKTPLYFDDQLKHLIQDKKLIILNEANALTILKHENYYRLSGYMIDFLNDKDEFKNDITFENIYDIYKTDKEIRSVLFELINDIEVYLKTQIANYFSLKYGADGYRNPSNFNENNANNYEDIINFLKKCTDIRKHNKNNLIVNHHDKHYKGFLPIWVIVELMSIGTISKFYSIMKTTDKKGICREGFHDITYEKLESFYHSITYLRNQCCHYQRFYRIKHPIKSKMYIPSDQNIQLNEYKTNSTYSLVLSLLFLNPNQKLGERAINKLKNIDSHSSIDLIKDYGFSPNWRDVLYNVNGYCIKK